MRKLSSVLLIDDDAHCHLFHKRVLQNAECSDAVHSVYDGAEAIRFLDAANESDGMWPELIFLDINMPTMDGWSFIEAYSRRHYRDSERTTIVLLTSSVNPDDQDRAVAHPSIDVFECKILTMPKLMQCLELVAKKCA